VLEEPASGRAMGALSTDEQGPAFNRAVFECCRDTTLGWSYCIYRFSVLQTSECPRLEYSSRWGGTYTHVQSLLEHIDPCSSPQADGIGGRDCLDQLSRHAMVDREDGFWIASV
jgi:hypothetical protein